MCFSNKYYVFSTKYAMISRGKNTKIIRYFYYFCKLELYNI